MLSFVRMAFPALFIFVLDFFRNASSLCFLSRAVLSVCERVLLERQSLRTALSPSLSFRRSPQLLLQRRLFRRSGNLLATVRFLFLSLRLCGTIEDTLGAPTGVLKTLAGYIKDNFTEAKKHSTSMSLSRFGLFMTAPSWVSFPVSLCNFA